MKRHNLFKEICEAVLEKNDEPERARPNYLATRWEALEEVLESAREEGRAESRKELADAMSVIGAIANDTREVSADAVLAQRDRHMELCADWLRKRV